MKTKERLIWFGLGFMLGAITLYVFLLLSAN